MSLHTPPCASDVDAVARLDALDDALLRMRRLFQRPGYRKQLLQGLSREVELATLRLLRAVELADEAPSVGAVAESLVIDPSTASRLVEGAVRESYLRRRACRDDRRRARLELTDEGVVVLREATERRRWLLGQVTEGWAPEELRLLVELLSKLQVGFDGLER
jgi:DNA-binding MarR family transcriptional regulator